jgi:hypothetical protein
MIRNETTDHSLRTRKNCLALFASTHSVLHALRLNASGLAHPPQKNTIFWGAGGGKGPVRRMGATTSVEASQALRDTCACCRALDDDLLERICFTLLEESTPIVHLAATCHVFNTILRGGVQTARADLTVKLFRLCTEDPSRARQDAIECRSLRLSTRLRDGCLQMNARSCCNIDLRLLRSSSALLDDVFKLVRVSGALQTLNICSMHIGDAGAKSLAEVLRVNAVVTELYLQDNFIGSVGADALAQALRVNAVLTTLLLGSNDIGEIGASALAESLKVNAVLTRLDLEHNAIRDKGAEALAGALCVNAVLKVLHLQDNKIADAGASAMADALSVNPVLTKLSLGAGDIGPSGAEALAGALRGNAVLTRLDLFHNAIGDKGAEALASALHVNTALATLYLHRNAIGDQGAKALASALRARAVHTYLDLACNDINKACKEHLRKAVSGRPGSQIYCI